MVSTEEAPIETASRRSTQERSRRPTQRRERIVNNRSHHHCRLGGTAWSTFERAVRHERLGHQLPSPWRVMQSAIGPAHPCAGSGARCDGVAQNDEG